MLDGNERRYVAAHAITAGYQLGATLGTIGGAGFWLLTHRFAYFTTEPTPASNTTTTTSTSTASTLTNTNTTTPYATKSKSQQLKRQTVSHIQSFRKPWHFLVQRMGTGSLLGGGLGMVYGIYNLYYHPFTCPVRHVLYNEATLAMPSTRQWQQLERITLYPATFHHAELLRHNFHTRMLESSVWLGMFGGIFAMAAEEGPVWLGLHRGVWGCAQAVSLGASFGYGLGMIVSWYIDHVMQQWNESIQKSKMMEMSSSSSLDDDDDDDEDMKKKKISSSSNSNEEKDSADTMTTETTSTSNSNRYPHN